MEISQRRKISMTVEKGIEKQEKGTSFVVEVSLRNDSDERIDSISDAPIYLSYHWFTENMEEERMHDRIRTPITPPSENTTGNIMNQTLAEIYNGNVAQRKWREGFSSCRVCTHFKSISDFEKLYPLLSDPFENLGG